MNNLDSDNFVEKVKEHVRNHDITEKMKEKDELDITELLKSIKKNLTISEKLITPKYRRGGIVGKLANFILEKFYRVTRKILYGSLSTQDSINYALFEALERLDKKMKDEQKPK